MIFHKFKILLFFGLLSVLTACGTVIVDPPDPIVVETDLPWVTQQIQGQGIQFHTFFVPRINSNYSYHIFLPAEYQTQTTKDYPVMYWLHGTGGGLSGIAPLSQYYNNAITQGLIPPMLIVFVNGLPNGMYVNSKDGKSPVEDIIIQDLIPRIDSQFRTIKTAQGRIIEGFSMGGYGAGRLGFKYPELFGGISMLGAGPLNSNFFDPAPTPLAERQRLLDLIYGGDMNYFYEVSPWNLAEVNKEKLKQLPVDIRILVGGNDSMLPANINFHQRLLQFGIPHLYDVVPNVGHETLNLLTNYGTQNWVFYNAVFGSN